MHSFVNNATLTRHACCEWQYNAKALGCDLYDTMMGTSFDIDVWALCSARVMQVFEKIERLSFESVTLLASRTVT